MKKGFHLWYYEKSLNFFLGAAGANSVVRNKRGDKMKVAYMVNKRYKGIFISNAIIQIKVDG